MQRTEVFHREELAKRLADDLMSEEGASGLFITGPRRTGKSTFIREDLIPVLKKKYASEVVYADLWEDRAANPGDVIVSAIKAQLLQYDGFILKAAGGVGLDRFKVGGLEMSLDNIGIGKGETLSKALTMLAAASKKPVTLIIDEAQQTQVTEEGRQALYALKAARDSMNSTAGAGFRLLATGSNSDKLASLVEDKDQAFYQVPLMPLPTLGKDYLQWFRNKQNFEPKPSIEAMIEAFDHCNHRPEPFRAVFKALKYKTDVTPEDIDEVFMSMVASSLASAKANFLQQVNGLNPLDLAALKVMARDDKKFSPYSKTSFADYKAFIFAQTGEMPEAIPQSSVQQALERLRGEKFVWRAGRGAYLIEDTQHAVWMKEVVEQSVDDVDRARREINARVATS
ncbi:MAG: hypothetical protein AUK51_17095 [Comamonadaceae bacterium CG2_30_59_20]|nr:MAG: hypothetical protein AUK51_17095 [Comamonadaceae bacterium CG2_30_59_20]